MSIAPVFANPLINDYVGLKTRARGISFVHLGMNLGHIFQAGVLYNLTN